MTDAPQEVYVPSVEQRDEVVVGLGVFSTEKIALSILKDFLKRSEQMDLISAEMTKWEIDIVGQEASSLLMRLANRQCPVCERGAFWLDLKSFNAQCYASGCGAWIEDNIHDEDIIDCGWPPLRFLHQASTVEIAMKKLEEMGARLKAAGQANSMLASQALLNEYDEAGLSDALIGQQLSGDALADVAAEDENVVGQ